MEVSQTGRLVVCLGRQSGEPYIIISLIIVSASLANIETKTLLLSYLMILFSLWLPGWLYGEMRQDCDVSITWGLKKYDFALGGRVAGNKTNTAQ